jgi:hypothetical protein
VIDEIRNNLTGAHMVFVTAGKPPATAGSPSPHLGRTGPIGPERRQYVDDRHGCRSTIVTSQLPVDHWYEVIVDPTRFEIESNPGKR